MRRGSVCWQAGGVSLFILFLPCLTRPCFAYSVVMHEAIIDAEWDNQIRPILLKRYPLATAADLRQAKSYAYGGSVIQDMGYYPLSGRFFSHLTHYVRSGDFVQALIDESTDINDYAFALGALSHYSADIKGHSLGVNRAVPLLYPRLSKKYGDYMTWEDSPYAHVLTEFAFDTLEVVAGHVAPQKYHDWIGFRVPEPLLRRAFRDTYGLEMKDELFCPRLAFVTYRKFASSVIPEMTEVAWALRGKSLESRAGSLHHRTLFHLRSPRIEASWEKTRKRPGPGDKLTAMIFRLLPKIGPLDVFQFHTPTEETEELFAHSLKAVVVDYEFRMTDGRFKLPELNLDTGRPTRPGEYKYGDATYARWLEKLARGHFTGVTGAMQADILSFYRDSTLDSMRRNSRQWRRVQRDVKQLASIHTP